MALLEVRNLRTWFPTRAGLAKAVDGVHLRVARGETLALVGESGSGKSVTACSILRLVLPPARVAGEVLFDGTDLLTLDAAGIRAVRGRRIGMIFQEPLAALNPVWTIGEQIVEAIRLHRPVSRRAAWAEAVALLDRVQMPLAARRAHEYPHRLSGGMRQRAVIAIALACGPDLLIADEPTTALDVTTQAQILALLKALQRESGMGLLLITHDLGVVAEVADRAAVMYGGRIVEEGPVASLFAQPDHPYTAGLLRSLQVEALAPGARLPEIPGVVPLPTAMPAGCAFAPRCERATAVCRSAVPMPAERAPGARSACFAPLRGPTAAVGAPETEEAPA